jgi:hypothetical protein
VAVDPATGPPDVVVLVYPDRTELRVVITSMADLPYVIAAALQRWHRGTTP